MPDNSRLEKYEEENLTKLARDNKEIMCKQLTLLDKWDDQTILQAVVMSEILGKPKAKRRKR